MRSHFIVLFQPCENMHYYIPYRERTTLQEDRNQGDDKSQNKYEEKTPNVEFDPCKAECYLLTEVAPTKNVMNNLCALSKWL